MSAEHVFALPLDGPSLDAEPARGSGVVRTSRLALEAPTVRPPLRPDGQLAGVRVRASLTIPAIAPQAVAFMKLSWKDVIGLDITHTEAFFLSLVDGSSTVETLVDVCGMPPVAAYAALARLVDLGVVQLRDS